MEALSIFPEKDVDGNPLYKGFPLVKLAPEELKLFNHRVVTNTLDYGSSLCHQLYEFPNHELHDIYSGIRIAIAKSLRGGTYFWNWAERNGYPWFAEDENAEADLAILRKQWVEIIIEYNTKVW